MRKQRIGMHAGKTIVILAIAAALYGADAQAETDKPDVDSNGRTAEQIINEARARVEAGTPPPEWQRRNNHKTEDDDEPPRPLTYYVGFTGEVPPSMSLGEVYRQRAEHRSTMPFQYLAPIDERHDPDDDEAGTLFAGVGLTDKLEIEFTYSEASASVRSTTPVFDTTLSGTQEIRASQSSEYESNQLHVTMLAHWRYHPLWSVYGRIGIGYADTKLESHIMTFGRTGSEQICRDENNVKRCYTSYTYAESDWGTERDRTGGFFPIIGVGIEFVRAFRVEFGFRPFVPMGDTTTNMVSDQMFSIRMFNSDWMIMK